MIVWHEEFPDYAERMTLITQWVWVHYEWDSTLTLI
jgi:hypothetical protein